MRDRLSTVRLRILKGINRGLLNSNPLEPLQSYALLTGCSSSEALEYLLSARLESIQSSVKVSSPSSAAILNVIHSIKSTLTGVDALFPFTFQKSINELKTTNLLAHADLHTYLRRRGDAVELWVPEEIKKFRIWTKSDILDNARVEEMVQAFMTNIEDSLNSSAGKLFSEIQNLDVLGELRREIVLSLVETDHESTPFEEKICRIFVTQIATQMTRLLSQKITKITELADTVKQLLLDSSGRFCSRS